MKKKNFKRLTSGIGRRIYLKSILVGFLIFGFLSFCFSVQAWTEPGQAPPGGNVAAPLNIGPTNQTKTGGLKIDGGGAFGGYSLDPSYRVTTPTFWTGSGAVGSNFTVYGALAVSGSSSVGGNMSWGGTLTSGAVPWARLTSFPGNCPSGQYVFGLGGSLSCSTPAGGISCSDCDARFVNVSGDTMTGQLTVRGPSSAANLALQYGSNTTWHLMAHSSDVFTIGQLGEYNMAINAAGRVGVGTTDPTQELDVVGYVKGRSGLCIGDDCRTIWPSGDGDGGDGNNYVTAISFSGTGTKTLTLFRSGMGPLTASFTDLTDGGGGIICSDCDYRFQREIGSNCGSGDYVYGVADDGTLRCRADQVGGGDGGGDITAVYAGTGLLGGGTSGDVTLSADTGYLQRRVSGTCAAGSSIRVIDSDGSVTCEPDDSGAGTQNIQQVLDTGNNAGLRDIWDLNTIQVKGDLYADGYMKVEKDFDAPNNSHGDCYWTSWISSGTPVQCINGHYMTGIHTFFDKKYLAIRCCKL